MTTPEPKRHLKVFLCHSSDDKRKVHALYMYLIRRGVDAWLDTEKLVPGQHWRTEIPKAIETSDVILVCLSKETVDKEGYVQKEIKFALDRALDMPEGRIFLIPARLEECQIPDSLREYQWVDLFGGSDGFNKLLLALNIRAEQVGSEPVQTFRPDNPLGEIVDKVLFPITQPVGPVPPLELKKSAALTSPAASSDVAKEQSKPFWQRTEVIVAIIGAVATILAAVISSWTSLVPPVPSTPTMTVTATVPIAVVSSTPTPTFTVTPTEVLPSLTSTQQTSSPTPTVSTTPTSTLSPTSTLASTFTPAPTVTFTPAPTISPEKIISIGYKNLKETAIWRFNSSVYSVAISPDGRWVVSGERNGRITFSTVPDGALFKQYNYGSAVYAISFSPDGRWLVAAGEGNEIMVLDTWTWDNPLLLSGHSEAVNALDFSEDGSFIVSGGLDGTLRIWQVAGWQLKQTIGVSRRIYAVDVSPSGEQVAVGSSDGVTRVWGLNGSLDYTLESGSGPAGSIISVRFSPDGSAIATGSIDPEHPYQVWDTQTRRLRLEFGAGLQTKGLVYSPDGEIIATYTNNRQLALWRASTVARLIYFESHQDAIWSAVFSKDGTLLVTASSDKTIRLWSIP